MPEGNLPIKSRTSGSQTIQQDLKGTTMELGKINTVKIARITPHGAYVTDAEPENTPEAPATATPETKECSSAHTRPSRIICRKYRSFPSSGVGSVFKSSGRFR